MQKVLDKFATKKFVVGVIGLGYVGLPLSLCFQEHNIRVIGFDIDAKKAEIIAKGKSYISHIRDEKIAKIVDEGFEATTDFSRIDEVDAIIICVPTPLNKYREPDLSFVVNTIQTILPYLKPHQVLSLESTTYPGTTDEEIKYRIESRGFTIGEDFYLIYSPEREDPGNSQYTTKTIPKVLGGITKNCTRVGLELYSKIIDKVIPVSSTKTAEMVKLLENIHRSVNIGLVNEMKIIADKMGIDIHEVIDVAASKPFGFTPYYPGPGVGGHCIPIDPFYLTWKAREYGLHTRFIELAGEINKSMPEYVVQKVIQSLNKKEKSIKNSKILIIGLAYKKNIEDARESPSLEIMEILRENEAKIDYHDPYLPVFPKMREHNFDLKSIDISVENVSKYDCVVISTAHDSIDFDLIKEHAKIIVDTRGVYFQNSENLVKA